jgi:Undecaprenyl-phosphate glucose phosphotransferase
MFHTPHMSSGTSSSAIPSPVSAFDAASEDALGTKSKATTHLTTAITVYVIIEFLAVACSAYFALYIYHFFFLRTWSWNQFAVYTPAAIAIATLVILISFGFHNFSAIRRQDRHKFMWSGIGAVALAFSFLLTFLFLTQLGDFYSRGTLLFQVVGAGFAVGVTRALFYSWLHSAIASERIEARRVALIGDNVHCSTFSDRLRFSGIRTVGRFRLPRYRNTRRRSVANPTIRNMIAELRSLRLDDIIILADDSITPAMLNLTSCLAELPVGIHIVPLNALDAIASAQITQFGNLRTLQLYRPPLSRFNLFIKRAFDLVCATVGLIVLSPLFLVVSIAIKLDSAGPVFFRQARHGFNNDEIVVFKFRSMTTMEDGGQFKQAVENDPRVTRIGRIIRSTNIDEIPQLINVLRGEMSIVGPRPHATAHNALFKDLIAPFSRRHNVKPGITGWAQVNGYRGATDTCEKMRQRIELDLQYIDNWSFLLDIKIIVMTLLSKRAYINAY